MYFDVLPAERMKRIAVSGIYMRLVAERLVHPRDILLALASFGQDSCCIWPWKLSVDHSPCALRVFERWPLRPTVDVNLFFTEVRGCKHID
jgi:hypothetical protein